MIHMSADEARQLLKKSEFVKMGPFVFIATERVTKRGHKKFGALAHCFKGKYHRHMFYIFRNNEIIFINQEDDEELF